MANRGFFFKDVARLSHQVMLGQSSLGSQDLFHGFILLNERASQPHGGWHQDKQKRLQERRVRSSEVSLGPENSWSASQSPHGLFPTPLPQLLRLLPSTLLAQPNLTLELTSPLHAEPSGQINPQTVPGKAVTRWGWRRKFPPMLPASFLEPFARIHSHPF